MHGTMNLKKGKSNPDTCDIAKTTGIPCNLLNLPNKANIASDLQVITNPARKIFIS
jgi:hypothetical protein